MTRTESMTITEANLAIRGIMPKASVTKTGSIYKVISADDEDYDALSEWLDDNHGGFTTMQEMVDAFTKHFGQTTMLAVNPDWTDEVLDRIAEYNIHADLCGSNIVEINTRDLQYVKEALEDLYDDEVTVVTPVRKKPEESFEMDLRTPDELRAAIKKHEDAIYRLRTALIKKL